MNKENFKNLIAHYEFALHAGQLHAAMNVNRELILLYHQIGITLVELGKKERLTQEFFANLQKNLKKNFPTLKGLDTDNLLYMQQFAEEYSCVDFVQEVLSQLTWGHIVLFLSNVRNLVSRRWYICQTIYNG